MPKKSIAISLIALGLLASNPVFAQTTTREDQQRLQNQTSQNTPTPGLAPTTTGTKADARASIACVSTSVATREQVIDSAMSTYTQAINAAYSARSMALQQAYATSAPKEVKLATNKAWSAFSTATKNARKAWYTAQKTTWSQFRTAAKACKAPEGVSDSARSSYEVVGQ